MASSSDGRRIPRGLRIIVFLHGLGALLAFLIFGLSMVNGDLSIGAVALAMAAWVAVLAWNLNAGRPWARTVALVLQALAFAAALWRLGQGTIDLNLVLAPAIFHTLLRDREVVAYFGVGRAAAAPVLA